MKSVEQSKARATNDLGSLWSILFETLSHYCPSKDARRAANVLLACAIAKPPQGQRFLSLTDVADVSEVLGSPVDLQPNVLEACSAALCGFRVALAQSAGGRWHLDAWIEAFQASDPARKSLGAFATPTVFADALAGVTIARDQCSLPKRIVDPAAGTGALLLAAHRQLVSLGLGHRAASLRLYGIELDASSRELCILLLWIAGGGCSALLKTLAEHIECRDALHVPWGERAQFDVVLINPPWESLRHARSDPTMARARTSALDRLENARDLDPTLPPLFTAQGRGDRNLAKMFIELAPHLLCTNGRLGAVLPAAFGSDDGMADLRRLLFTHMALDRWTTFENIQRHFNIDSRYKFGLLTGTRSDSGTTALEVRAFCSDPKETNEHHVRLDGLQISHIGGPDRMIPEVVSASERDAIASALSCGIPFFDGGALGLVEYRREVDLTLGRERNLFWPVDEMPPAPYGELRIEDTRSLVPLIEGRMVGQYDCFQKSWLEGHGRRAIWRNNGDLPLDRCRPQYVAHRRPQHPYRVAICDVTSATNARTVHATLVPEGWVCGNTAPVLQFESEKAALAALAILNSMAFDWIARRIVGGLHLNRFYLARMAWPSLTSTDVSRLAACARKIASAHPRGLPGSTGATDPRSALIDMVAVEQMVLDGFGMTKAMRRAIYREDRSDRRGFWRYFESSEIGLRVARLTLGDDVTAPIAAE